MQEIQIHPAAECVRLMDDEELASLAASIEAHGQRDPIIMARVNGATTELLADGRNRLRACEIAKVEPRFEVMAFEDDEAVKAFVSDKSEHRNLTKGQQAMRLALLYPEPGKGGRGKSGIGKTIRDNRTVSQDRLGQARSVLAYSRVLALAVRDGKPLDEALAEVKAAREAMNTNEAMLAQLRSEAPDLADLVEEERMKPKEAMAAANERAESLIRQRKIVADEIARTLDFFVQDNVDAATRADQIAALFDVTKVTAELKQMSETLALLVKRAGKGNANGK
jgi:hypothetical protein